MRVLDLFSGIGGFSLGLERAGMETVAFCEIEPFCQKVLAKHWPDVPIYTDIKTLTAERLKADGIAADVICGGYPCQPFSHAGKRAGETDDRHLWPEMYRLIETIRPRWVLAENVAGHITMGLDAVLSDLEAAHYTTWVFVIPACAVDARHRRDRVWIVAHSECGGWGKQLRTDASWKPFSEAERKEGALGVGSGCEAVANTIREPKQRSLNGSGQAGGRKATPARSVDSGDEGSGIGQPGPLWLPEPNVGRVAHGIPNRVDRLKSLGNSVVPQVVEAIGHAIMDAQNS